MPSMTIHEQSGIVRFSDGRQMSFNKDISKCIVLLQYLKNWQEILKIDSNSYSACFHAIHTLDSHAISLQDLFQRFSIYPDAYIIYDKKTGWFFSSQRQYKKHMLSLKNCKYEIIPYKKAVQRLIQELSPKF